MFQNSIPVYLINLIRDEERRIKSMAQLEAVGVTPIVIAAIDGHQHDFPFHEYANLSNGKWWGENVFKPGAFACYLSHIECWKKIVADERPFAMVLEDDILIKADAFRSFDMGTLPERFDVVFINHGVTRLLKKTTFHSTAPFIRANDLLMDVLKNGRYHNDLNPGSYGYIVSREGAARLLAMAEQYKISADIDFHLLFASLDNENIQTIKMLPNVPSYVQIFMDEVCEEPFYYDGSRVILDTYVYTRNEPIAHDYGIKSSLNHKTFKDFIVFEKDTDKPEEASGSDKLVSIIIPCYNQAQYLEEAVQSVIDQTYPYIEIIIVNDGSPDNTAEIATSLQKKYPNKIRISTQENAGLYAARNNGIRSASGKYILPLDSDDMIAPKTISRCLDTMDKENADIVYFDFQCFGLTDRVYLKEEFSKNNPLYKTPSGSTALYKRVVWEKTGGYKKNMGDGYEDWEFWVNAYKCGFKFQHHPEIFLLYRTKAESMFTNAYKKDAYLKAKIVMNHPELYLTYQVVEAMEMIKKTESLPEMYFYYFPDAFADDKKVVFEVGEYLRENVLQFKQVLKTSDKRIGLCSLDLFESAESLPRMLDEINADSVIYYAPMRYEASGLRISDFAWNHTGSIVETFGTAFPFIEKSVREDPKLQAIAYQRLKAYCEKNRVDLHIQTVKHNDYLQAMKQKKIDASDIYTILAQNMILPKEGIELNDVYGKILEFSRKEGAALVVKGKLIRSAADRSGRAALIEIVKSDHTNIPNGLCLSGNQKFLYSYFNINNETNEFSVTFELKYLDDLVSMKIKPWYNQLQLYIDKYIRIEIKNITNTEYVYEKILETTSTG